MLERILCVEDEPDIREVAKLALEVVGGFTAHLCASGQEAVEQAQAFAPQLILLDMMMPGMDGISTLKALRALPGLAHTPVMFMTAKVQPGEVEQYRALGAGVVPKPFDPMTLADLVRQYWQSQAG